MKGFQKQVPIIFVEKNLLSEDMVREFHDAMVLREDADYHRKFSKEGAEDTIKTAKEFLNTAKTILKIK